MALVTLLEPSSKDRQSVHGPTRCLYSIVVAPDGERYLQLDTVGSGDRALPDKVSQSIQFNRESAGQLIHLFRQTFPDLIEGSATPQTGDNESSESEEESIEGRVLFKLHRMKERDRRLVHKKKQSVIKTTGRLQCEVCEFDFAVIYGHIGEGFAECHHRVPLSTLDGTSPTKLSDLSIVCANCHRMLHRPSAPTVEELRQIVQFARTATVTG